MRKVLEAHFHQAVFIKNIGELGRTLSSQTSLQGNKTLKVDMETDGVGLYMKLESVRGVKAEAFVPVANVVVLLLAPKDA